MAGRAFRCRARLGNDRPGTRPRDDPGAGSPFLSSASSTSGHSRWPGSVPFVPDVLLRKIVARHRRCIVGELVQVEAQQSVATIRLDRPPMNALNASVQEGLTQAAAQVSADPTVRAVVLYGGEKLFAAGADIKEMSGTSYAQMSTDAKRLQDALTAVASIAKPVIAAVTGYALGGGLELALCADFRVLGQSARVGQPEILLGLIPGAGGTQRLPRLIGPAR